MADGVDPRRDGPERSFRTGSDVGLAEADVDQVGERDDAVLPRGMLGQQTVSCHHGPAAGAPRRGLLARWPVVVFSEKRLHISKRRQSTEIRPP
jgi:hypothetical protein